MKISEDIRISLRSIKKRPVESLLLILGVALGIGATAAGVSMISLSNKQSRDLLASTKYKEILVAVRESAADMELPAVVRQESDVFLTTMDLRARNDVPDLEYAYTSSRIRVRLGNFNFGGQTQQGGDRTQGGAAGNTSGTVPGTAPGTDRAAAPGAASGQTPSAAAAQGGSDAPTEDAAPSGRTRPDQGSRDNTAAQGSAGAATERAAPPQGSLPPQGGQPPPDGGQPPPGGQPPAGGQGGGFGDFFNQPAPVVEGPQPILEEVFGYRVTPEFFDAWGLYAAEGSLFSLADMEQNARVMILGSELAPLLFEDGESMGRDLLAQRQLYKIAGILEPSGTDFDTMAFIPERIVDPERIPAFARQFINTTLHFTARDPNRLDEAKAQLSEWFDQTYGTGLVTISIPREEAQAARDRNSRLVTVIFFLAIAGLLIASVNVSNILLGRAMRKRKNVGILKALGATIRDVFGLFFLEALIIGAGGAALGAGVSFVISELMDAAITGGALATGMLFLGILAAWAVTTSLTVIPALQASRIPAAEALRYE